MRIIKRELLSDLENHLKEKEISLITGPRQAGKTTLMLFLKRSLEENGERTLFLSLDFEEDRKFFSSAESLVKKIELEIGKQKGYVFIDEIQRKENAGLFLKGLYDLSLPYKFIVTGSGGLELKEKIKESLIGRKKIFELPTVSFFEFVNFKTDYHYEKNLSDFFALEKEKTKKLLEEYLNFGGYPRVVLEETQEKKAGVIREIYESYLEKDITYLLEVRKPEAFSNLVKVLADQSGKLLNFSELSSTLGLSVATLQTYLWYLQKTFILEKISPFYRNVRKEITKAPLVYFLDLGLKNFSLGSFGQIALPILPGFLFQNFIFGILAESSSSTSGPVEIHFWRSKDGAEVDFILQKGEEVLPIEVKGADLRGTQVPKSLRSFIKKYSPPRARVVNLFYEGTLRVNKTKVEFVPFYRLRESLQSFLT